MQQDVLDNICCNVDESGKDDAQGNNPDSKGHLWCDPTDVKSPG